MISANDLKKGTTIKLDGELYTVTDHQHFKPGKGGAFVRTKLRLLKKNSIVEKTFRSEEKVEEAYIERRYVQYLYEEGDHIVVMDNENYEQENVSKEIVGDNIQFLKEGMDIEIDIFEGAVINVFPPMFVEMKVIHTEPGLKGDTVSGATKPATVETGYTLNVPLFVNTDDILKIDTRTGDYVERVK
ncbi:MAG: elongation factor P [Spirochaetota bacterium]|nr:elongation factor P [Spirochaetota bacterium]